jgi:putative transposase
MMLDGLELKGRMMIVALGITTEGVKVPLGLWGDRRRTRRSRPRCCRTWSRAAWILSKGCCSCSTAQRALRKAVRSVFGEVPVQRCIRHKERNILAHLPERDRPPIKARLRRAWADTDYDRALEQLQRLADELEHTHPGAAGSLREGMHETLTVIGLGVNGKLRKTLESTNPAESMIDCVRTTQRNVKHWSSGEMGLRWTAAGMLEAEKQFRKVIGYTQLPQLAVAIERRLHTHQPNPETTQDAAIAVTV